MKPGDVVTPLSADRGEGGRRTAWAAFLADLEHDARGSLGELATMLRFGVARLAALEAQRDELLSTALGLLGPWESRAELPPAWVAELRRGLARAAGAGDLAATRAAGRCGARAVEVAPPIAPVAIGGDTNLYGSAEAFGREVAPELEETAEAPAVPPREPSAFGPWGDADPLWCAACRGTFAAGDRVARLDGGDARCERCAVGESADPSPSPRSKKPKRPHAPDPKPPAERVQAPPPAAWEALGLFAPRNSPEASVRGHDAARCDRDAEGAPARRGGA